MRRGRGKGVEPYKTDEMEGSELIDLECGSIQVKNNLARLAGSSYRFGNLCWESYRVVLHLRH